MQIAAFSLLAAATLGLAADLIIREDLPDGVYLWMNHPNGTITALPLGASDAEAIPVAPVEAPVQGQAEALQKRFVDCWGTALDTTAIDEAVYALKEWAGVGGHQLDSPVGGTISVRARVRGMQVYYCINTEAGYHGNLDINDINYALSNMDARCPRYTASYFQWDGSPEIVGKANENTPVCCGPRTTC